MAVTFTPNIGLAKPTEVELANNWAENTKLCEDNNIIIQNSLDTTIMASYNPTFIAPTNNPNVGAGSIRGEYCKINGFVIGGFSIRCDDPGVFEGSGIGAFGISLPVLADATFHTVNTSLTSSMGFSSVVGEGYIKDNSSIPLSGTVALELAHIGGVAYVRMMTETYAGKTTYWVGPNFPFSLGDGDQLTGSFMYKAA